MEGSSKERTKLAVNLVRKGAIILAEPCPTCGGVQVRYRGKVHCSSHEDLTDVAKLEGASFDDVVSNAREVLLVKMGDALRRLEGETEPGKQAELAALLASYFDLIQKLPSKRQSP